MILPLTRNSHSELMFSGLKQVANIRQNRYQRVPFCVCIHNLMFSFLRKCSENSLGTIVILHHICKGHL